MVRFCVANFSDTHTHRHLRYERPAGLLITLYVYIVYIIALRYEG
jgi:hypothetical protein